MEMFGLLILLGLIPAVIAKNKGRSFGLWWFFGMALFVVALPLAIIMKSDKSVLEKRQLSDGMKKCPYCAELIKFEAVVCRYCGRDVPIHTPTTSEERPTPLMQAVIDDNIDLVESLLRDGANPLEQDAKGRNPLQLAQKLQNPYLVELLSTWEKPEAKTG